MVTSEQRHEQGGGRPDADEFNAMLSTVIKGGRPVQIVVAAGAAILLAIYTLAAVIVIETRETDIDRAAKQLATLNTLLVEDTSRVLDGVQLAVAGVSERLIENMSITSAVSFDWIVSRPEFTDFLRNQASILPQVGAITVFNANGDLLNYSRPEPLPEMNVQDREYYQFFVNNPDETLHLSGPVANRFNGELTIYLARKIRTNDGEFAGMVLGVVELRYFEALYRSLDIGEGASISLWERGGILLARHPVVEGAVGQPYEAGFLRHQVSDQTVHVFTVEHPVSDLGHGARIVAAKALSDYPLVVNVAFARDVILAHWTQSSIYIAVGCLIITLMALVLVRSLASRLQQVEKLKQAMAEREEAIKEREVAEEHLRQVQKLEAVGQLTAGIAHDFNNLLTVVIGNLEILGRRIKADESPTSNRAIEQAMAGAKKAAILTHRLLAFARKQPLAPEHVELPKLVTGIVDMLSRTLGENIAISTDLKPDLWPVHVDTNQLENVLVNLAINSRDAMPEGGNLRISLRNVSIQESGVPTYDGLQGDFVAIAVSDDGHGMPADVMVRAFEPFFTTKGIGKGSGLGLSQVYGFAKQSGGGSTIESAEGRGTTVTLYLPRSTAATDARDGDETGESGYLMGAGETILLVDDNEEVRQYAALALRELRYRVLEAGSAEEALRVLKANRIDLMLSDVGLPQMDGKELAHLARQIDPHMPVIFMTGYAKGEVLKGGGISPDDVIIQKPFSYSDISRRVGEALSGHRLENAG